MREKYCFGWKFTIVYDKPQPNEQAVLNTSNVKLNNCLGPLHGEGTEHSTSFSEPLQSHNQICIWRLKSDMDAEHGTLGKALDLDCGLKQMMQR